MIHSRTQLEKSSVLCTMSVCALVCADCKLSACERATSRCIILHWASEFTSKRGATSLSMKEEGITRKQEASLADLGQSAGA